MVLTFTVSELLKENQQSVELPSTQIKVNNSTSFFFKESKQDRHWKKLNNLLKNHPAQKNVTAITILHCSDQRPIRFALQGGPQLLHH